MFSKDNNQTLGVGRIKKRPIRIIRLILIIALLLAGAYIIVKPWFNAWRFNVAQNQIMKAWRDSSYIENSLPEGNSPAWTRSSTVADDSGFFSVWEEDISPRADVNYLAGVVEGILIIDKISLTAPIFSEYTVSNLNVSICSVIAKNHMGEPGNYVLAGHASRIYGRHFNRLREVAVGDIIIVEDGTTRYSYRVTEVFTVTPTDVWVMYDDGDRKLITLISCDYRVNPVGRLIVRGELIEDVSYELSED